MKTYSPRKKEIKRGWYLFDAQGETLGRFAPRLASLLMGKNKPSFSYHLDSGNYVVVINAARLKVTGKKIEQKIYYHYTGYPGGIKEITLGKLLAKDPAKVVEKAVWGMLPKNKLRQARMKRLKIFADGKHPYSQKELIKI